MRRYVLKKRVLGVIILLGAFGLMLQGCGGGTGDANGDTVYITVGNSTQLTVTASIANPTPTVNNFTVASTAYPGITNPSQVQVNSVEVSYTPLRYDGVNFSPPLTVTYSQITQPLPISAGGSTVIQVGVVDADIKTYLNGTSVEATDIRTLLATLGGSPLKYTAHILVRAVEIGTGRDLNDSTTCEVYLTE